MAKWNLGDWLTGKWQKGQEQEEIGKEYAKTQEAIGKAYSLDQYNPAIKKLEESTQALTQNALNVNERQKKLNQPKIAQFLARTGSVSTPQVASVLGGMMKDADANTQQQILNLNQAQADKLVGIVNALVHAKGSYVASTEMSKLKDMLNAGVEPPINTLIKLATGVGLGGITAPATTGGKYGYNILKGFSSILGGK